jgi:hypothetical protein
MWMVCIMLGKSHYTSTSKGLIVLKSQEVESASYIHIGTAYHLDPCRRLQVLYYRLNYPAFWWGSCNYRALPSQGYDIFL